jgi:hypothetical protein
MQVPNASGRCAASLRICRKMPISSREWRRNGAWDSCSIRRWRRPGGVPAEWPGRGWATPIFGSTRSAAWQGWCWRRSCRSPIRGAGAALGLRAGHLRHDVATAAQPAMPVPAATALHFRA